MEDRITIPNKLVLEGRANAVVTLLALDGFFIKAPVVMFAKGRTDIQEENFYINTYLEVGNVFKYWFVPDKIAMSRLALRYIERLSGRTTLQWLRLLPEVK